MLRGPLLRTAGQVGVGTSDEIESAPLARHDGEAGEKLFETLDPKAIGIDFFGKSTKMAGHDRENPTGSGVAAGDYDGDGLVDVFLPRATDGGRLYHNLGDFRFEDVSEHAGIAGPGNWTTGATFVDINNDGQLDLYVCGYGCPNHLYINRGDGTFEECARECGLDFVGSSVMMAFADYDLDGDLDGYLVTNHFPPPEEIEYRLEIDSHGIPSVPEQYHEYHGMLRLDNGDYGVVAAAQRDHLYRNDGSGKFTDVTNDAGIADFAHGLSATWWDFNSDGYPDLYVANDFFAADRLYRNNGDGTFTDVASQTFPCTPWFSMGTDLADINKDGLFDLMGTDMAATTDFRAKLTIGEIYDFIWFLERPIPRQYMRNTVYLNTGTGRMLEVAYLAGLDRTNWTWSIRFADLDQDGNVDVFITNGMSHDVTNIDLKNEALKRGPLNSDVFNAFWDTQPPLAEANLAFKNLGNLQFKDVSAAWGLDHVGVSFGAALGDLDNDGDLDLVVNNLDDMVSIFRNAGTTGHAVRIRLKGTQSNRWGIGATVRARVGADIQSRYLTLSRGFMSSGDATVHFGLGDAEQVDELVVQWPSGHTQRFADLPTDRLYTIKEPAGSAAASNPDDGQRPKPLFCPSDVLHLLKHSEKQFDDFAREPLLPMRLSQLGPGLAVGDVDGDGLDDAFLGGAKGDWGALVINHGTGDWSFTEETFPPWCDDSDCEDLGALVFDADGDGDADLFIASGGVECEPGDVGLRNRLYLNDGSGVFTHASPEQLPDLRDSSSVVAAADYDRDGDLDLVVGGRSVPGQFPVTPHSRLLNNTAGNFRDATADDAPELLESGLVTSALWTDVNGDGWIDLLITHDWGPVKLYRNDHGQLHDATAEAGLADLFGWWNGIAGRDLDGDGDIDYVVTNLGRNTAYHVTRDRPARLFYGDFNGDGLPLLVEGKYDEAGRLVPSRSKPEIERALPFVEAACPTYREYASATLADIVGQDVLDNALQRAANISDSVLLRNDGHGRFTVESLPVLAQVAPGFGIVLSDFNADGLTDAYIAQNLYAPRREIGRMDGGMSVLLLGREDGDFATAPPVESGLVVPGDAKSVVSTDVNGDGWPDLVVGVNDAPVLVFENQHVAGRRLAAVRLRGRPGNPTGVGARVTLRRSDGRTQMAEVQAGGGYLSQQSATLYFGLGESSDVASVDVRWPDGQSSRYVPEPNELVIEIEQPQDSI